MVRSMVYTLSFLMVIAPVAQATDGPKPLPNSNQANAVQLKNVELDENDSLNGQLLNEAGQPLAGEQVVLLQANQRHTTMTDARGRFQVPGLQNGNAAVVYNGRVSACRVWKRGIAPPSAVRQVAVVDGNPDVVRGNFPALVLPYFGQGSLALKLLGIAAIAGGTVAIVEGAQNDDDDAS